jgi:hypothetical protein
MERFVRRCDATGCGMNEGFVFGDGELYFSTQEHLIAHLKQLDWIDCDNNKSQDIKNDDDLLDYFYREDQCYYTEWYEDDIDDVYYDADGNEYELQ